MRPDPQEIQGQLGQRLLNRAESERTIEEPSCQLQPPMVLRDRQELPYAPGDGGDGSQSAATCPCCPTPAITGAPQAGAAVALQRA